MTAITKKSNAVAAKPQSCMLKRLTRLINTCPNQKPAIANALVIDANWAFVITCLRLDRPSFGINSLRMVLLNEPKLYMKTFIMNQVLEVPSNTLQKDIMASQTFLCWDSGMPGAALCFAVSKACDSCIRHRKPKATREGNAPKAKRRRQVASMEAPAETVTSVMQDESIMPKPCMEMTMAMYRPRTCASVADSAVTVAERGYSPPTPSPRSRRVSANCKGRLNAPLLCTQQAPRAAPTTVRAAVTTKVHFRPSQSAT
mmetsp:Transcript_99070/g.212238  ORF Transcript_99070/g.212238 Transcript_99070/m.212238 type:complete len:258 (+) Transcript_99070:428-1201(+)